MDRPSLRQMLREILGPNVSLVDHPNWIGMRCPFAPFKHARGTDEKPSCGISVHPNGKSVFRCYTCTAKGLPLEGFLKEYDKYTGAVPASLIRDAKDEEFYGGKLMEWGQHDAAELPATLSAPLDPHIYLNLYDDAFDHPYVKHRGISEVTAEEIGLMYDPEDSEGEERIIFPVYAPNGDLHGFTGRAIRKGARLKVRDYHGLKKSLLLLGSHLIDPRKDKFVIVVEGLFDYAMMREYELPAVASMMADITSAQAKILKQFGLPVYSLYDDDDAGHRAKDSLKHYLHRHVPVFKTRFPKVKFRDRDTGKLRWAQDPDEFSKDEILGILEDAKMM